jgi:preprotein translocase subunit SecD
MNRRLAFNLVSILLIAAGVLVGNLVAGNKPSLGLDLQGGVSVTQEPVGEFNTESLDLAVERIRDRVDSLGVAEPEIIRQGNAIVVNLPGVDNQDDALRLVQVTGAVLLRPVLQAIPISSNSSGPLSSTTAAPAGTDVPAGTEPAATTVAPSSSAATTVAPGPSRALPASATLPSTPPSTETLTATPPSDAPSTDVPSTDVPSTDAPTGSAVDGSSPSTLPGGDPADPTATVYVQSIDGSELYQLGPAFATGEVFKDDAAADIINGGWGVRVSLKSGAEGANLWNIGAASCFSGSPQCPTKRMAIVLDGVVQSAPTVNQPQFTGGVDITGTFTEREAKDLARVLKSGALPVRLQVQAVQTVSATLGEDSLRAAIIAGLIGIALVLLFMILYYRTLALVVVAGLVVSGAIQWNIISLLSKTNGLALSLSGIAGIIVSIGVTVDSYVVFFEKLKDEVKAGRSLKNSAERGFRSAWRTIIAADTVSLLGAFTLWYLTVGSVRGFAFFLGLSTLCDIVVAWFFTRPTMLLLARSGRFERRRTFGIDVATEGAS